MITELGSTAGKIVILDEIDEMIDNYAVIIPDDCREVKGFISITLAKKVYMFSGCEDSF
jgi:hypothetical protein